MKIIYLIPLLGLVAFFCLAVVWDPSAHAFISTLFFVLFLFVIAIEVDNLECG